MDVRPSGRCWPEKVAILLLAIPTALFVGFWFRPLLGLPAAAITLWVAWKLMKEIQPLRVPPLRGMLIAAAVAALWTWTAGLGGFYYQEWDHNFRNALLHDLINNPWPVVWKVQNDTIVLDYYLAWSLIPALVGKLLGWRAATLAMATISGFGVFLIMIIFARVAGAWRWWLPFVFVLWSGLDIVGWAMRWVYKGDYPGYESFIDAWSFPLWFLSHTVNYYCVAHLIVPGWIVTLLITGHRVGSRSVGALFSYLIPMAPFVAIGTAPFVIWGALQGDGTFMTRVRRAMTLESVVMPLMLAMLCAPLYLGNQGLGKGNGWFYEYAPIQTTSWIKYASFWGLEVLIPALAIWLCGFRDRLLLLTVAVLCLVSIRRTGISNDIALKASVPGLLVLSLYTYRALVAKIPAQRAKWFLIGVFAIGAVSPLHELYRSTYATLYETKAPLEKDMIKTFDPNHVPPYFESAYVPNFQSRPLSELPLLRWMMAMDRRES